MILTGFKGGSVKGILFKPDMIKAIVEGRKTVTRRVIKPQPQLTIPDDVYLKNMESLGWKYRYQPGETVYIKEAWRIINPIGKFFHNPYDFGIEYLSSNHEVKWWTDNGNTMDYPLDEKVRSPMFLPEKFARYLIKMKDVRAESLQKITPMDCIKEGIPPLYELGVEGLVHRYHTLWDSINKPPYDWNSNPWVFRYEFILTPITRAIGVE